MKTEYPGKIILAWAEAIGGNKEIRDWLLKNGYPELGIFTFALRNKQEARDWLMDNGHPHLLAMIEGSEGKEQALKWLEGYGFTLLAHVARVADGDETSFQWLLHRDHRDFAMVGKKMEQVKDEVQWDNDDWHKISKD
jgi:hypothetical protein